MADVLLSSLLSGGGVKSIQTGYLDNVTPLTSTVEDEYYYNVTVSAVVVANCMCFFQGGGGADANTAMLKGGTVTYDITARMTSTTQLRLAFRATLGTGKITGRYYIIEYI